jgi:hypothetical protein
MNSKSKTSNHDERPAGVNDVICRSSPHEKKQAGGVGRIHDLAVISRDGIKHGDQDVARWYMFSVLCTSYSVTQALVLCPGPCRYHGKA